MYSLTTTTTLLLSILLLLTLPHYNISVQDDPINYNPALQVGDPISTDSDKCVSFESGACADIWEPVCDMEDVITYANCCEAKRENVTEVLLGECCPNCTVFGATKEPFGTPGVVVDDQDDLMKDKTGTRKLLQTGTDPEQKNITVEEVFAFAGISPFQPLGVNFERLIGADDRVLVGVTEQFPFAAVGRLGSGCTGFLVGPRHVLTLGHCIYNLGDWQQNQKFTPGQNNISLPFGEIDWYAVRVAREWFDDQTKVDYNYGMVYLTQDIGDETGVMEYESRCDRNSLPLNLLGYPTDKMPKNTMWLSSCGNINYNCTAKTYTHQCDTFAGMSGGPMFLYEATPGNRVKYSVLGLHFGSDFGNQNLGITMTEEMVADIKDWIENDQRPDNLP